MRCRVCSEDHAGPGAGDTTRLRAGQRAGDAIPGRNGGEESCYPEGVFDLLRQFEAGGPGSSGTGCARAEGRGRRAVLFGRGEQVGAGGSGAAGHLADAGGSGRESAASGMRAVHRPRGGLAGKRRGWDLVNEPEFQGTDGIARCAVLSRQPRGGGGFRGGEEKVEILAGFPERVKGRLVFLPPDNVNTDAIYGKDYTYRDDMTKELMAQVVMENYDPRFAARTEAGDVIVGGFNFGTGSSREQAVTCLKAKGIPLVIAASFSQTYLRNAYNNGFLCVEVPELVRRLRQQFSKEVAAKEKTIIPGDEIDVDFTSSVIAWRGERFTFPALGSVPQSLVIAEGVENLVAKRLGLA